MAGMDREWLDKLLYKSNIVTLVSRYVPLERKGRTHWGRCPFHHEKTPSFAVDEGKQFYYCFGCHASGDAIKFIENIESVEFYDAVKLLANDANMELPAFKDDKEYQAKKAQTDLVIKINREAAKFYHSSLMGQAGKEALQYLTNRGFSLETIRKFGLGYSPRDNDAIMYLTGIGYTHEQLKFAGIADQSQKGYYDVFYGRLIVPIINAFNDVIGFGGRSLVSTDFAKYRNTQASKVFDKSNVLFAVNELKKAKQSGPVEYVILAEGYMDVIALHAAGFNTAVASMGTSITSGQARTLARYAPLVYISFDGDSAGQKAALRGLDILDEAGLEVKVISMPEGTDPDDYIKQKGADAYRRLLLSAVPLMRYKLTALSKGFDMTNVEGRTKFALKAVDEIKKTKNSIEREGSLAILQEITGFTMASLAKQLEQGGVNDNVQTTLIPQIRDNYQQKAIKYILWSIINNKELYIDKGAFSDVLELLEEYGIEGTPKKLLKFLQSGGSINTVFREFEQEEHTELAKILNYSSEYSQEDFEGYYSRIKIQVLERRQQDLAKKLDGLIGAGATKEETDALFAQITSTTGQILQLKTKRS